MLRISLALALCLPTAAIAQRAAEPALLPANSEVPLVLDQEVSSKRVKVGDAFDVSVARDVWVGGQLAIPRGARGRGVVVWKTGKGAFGKSGKLEIELRSVEVAGQLVPLTGKYRQEGQGNTAATVGTIVAAGVIAGMFVTGHSAVFTQGTELRGYTGAPFAAVRPSTLMQQQYAAVASPMVAGVGKSAPAAMSTIVVEAKLTKPPVPATAVPHQVIYTAQASSHTPLTAPAATPVVLASSTVAAFTPAASAVPVATVPQPVAYVRPALPRAPLPVAYATTAEDKADRFAQLLSAQQGVRGRDARQGWTISD